MSVHRVHLILVVDNDTGTTYLLHVLEHAREQDGSWATTNRTVSGRAEATDARQRPGLGAGLWT
jgi:hypothetical protein